MPQPLSMQAMDDPAANLIWAENRANELMKEFGLLDAGWSFRWDRAARRLGVCKHRRKEIAFSQHFDHITREEIEDTIRHEIAHALVGPNHGHDRVWRAKCIEVGAKPQRLADEHIKSQAQHNYRVYCVDCGYSFLRYRLRQALLDRYKCGKCGGKFDAELL